jgi:predicted nucleic acid-binding protein
MQNGIFLDTNILIYSLDPADADKRAKAAALIRGAARADRLVVSPQALNECYRVLTDRRAIMPREDARRFVGSLVPHCKAPSDAGNLARAFDIQDATGFAWWDCLMLASAVRAGCRLFLTEDMDHGRLVGELRIVDLFRTDTDLETLLN